MSRPAELRIHKGENAYHKLVGDRMQEQRLHPRDNRGRFLSIKKRNIALDRKRKRLLKEQTNPVFEAALLKFEADFA